MLRKFGECLCAKSKLVSGTLMEHLRAISSAVTSGCINTDEIRIKEGDGVNIGYENTLVKIAEEDGVKILSQNMDTKIKNSRGDKVNGVC